MIAPVNQGVAPTTAPIIQTPPGAANNAVPFVRPPSPLSAPLAAPPAPAPLNNAVPFVRPTAPVNPTPVVNPVSPVATPVATPPAFKTPIIPYIPQPQLPAEQLPKGSYYPSAPFGLGQTRVPFVPRPANVPDWAWPYPEPPLSNEMPSEAAAAGPIVEPATEGSPNQNGIVDGGLYRITWDKDENYIDGVGPAPTETRNVYGPVTRLPNVRTVPFPQFPLRYRLEAVYQARTTPTGAFFQFFYEIEDTANNGDLQTRNGRGSVVRLNGPPDPAEDPATEPIRAPNPARQVNPTPLPVLPRPQFPTPQTQPEPDPERDDLAWPQTPSPPTPSPLRPINPTRAPETPPGFSPTPTPTQEPTPPGTDPFNPSPIPPVLPAFPIPALPSRTNPSAPKFTPAQPSTRPSDRPSPSTPFLPQINPSSATGLVNLPLNLPGGLIQPVVTPVPNIGEAPEQNPNIRPTEPPVSTAPPATSKCCPDLWGEKNFNELQKLKRSVGTDGMPVSVPDQIAKENPSQILINSLAELHLWQVQQLDGVMGRWPQQIPIPTPAGPVNVGMPNMAEAVAEMVGMMVSQQVTATQILNTSSRALVQAGSATQQAHLAHLVAKANAEFLGYESRPTEVDMPLAFDPGKDPFDGLLNESTQKIRGFENTDGQDIKAIFADLLQAAAIIRAVYWRKLDPRGDLRKQIKDQLRGQSDFIDQAAAGNGDDSDWEAYLRAVEEGFRGATGEDNPYNRRPDEGPQIRDRSPGNDNQR